MQSLAEWAQATFGRVDLDDAYRLLNQLRDSGAWKGYTIDWTIKKLEEAIRRRSAG